jgi:hypothetical protein
VSGFRIGGILDCGARVRSYGSGSLYMSRWAGGCLGVTGNATVSGFGTVDSRRFWVESRGRKGVGENYREKIRVEGEVFREPSGEIGRNGRSRGAEVRLFGSRGAVGNNSRIPSYATAADFCG